MLKIFSTALMLFIASVYPAAADGFDVRPVLLRTNNGSVSFTVSNPGDARIYISTTVNVWSRDARGNDILTESNEAAVSPPAMWVEPHASYAVRVKLPAASGQREIPFRVLVQNVPSRADITAGRVVMSVTQSIPAFSEPSELSPPALSAVLEGGRLFIINDGGRHVRIEGISQDGHVIAKGLLGYALGGTRTGINAGVHSGRIEIDTDTGRQPLQVR